MFQRVVIFIVFCDLDDFRLFDNFQLANNSTYTIRQFILLLQADKISFSQLQTKLHSIADKAIKHQTLNGMNVHGTTVKRKRSNAILFVIILSNKVHYSLCLHFYLMPLTA